MVHREYRVDLICGIDGTKWIAGVWKFRMEFDLSHTSARHYTHANRDYRHMSCLYNKFGASCGRIF